MKRKNNHIRYIHARLTEEEYAHMKLQMTIHGYPSVSGYLRDLIMLKRLPPRRVVCRITDRELRDRINILIYQVNNNIEGGYIGMKKMIGNLLRKPDAVFASSDEIAYGAIDALKEMKLRVPEDIAVTGFGNDRMSSLMEPKVTTVELPYRKMGIYGARMLFDQIEEKKAKGEKRRRPKKIQLQTKMRVRKSCGHRERIGEMF